LCNDKLTANGVVMHWTQRRMRRPAANEPGHAHELTFSCFRGFPFLRSDRSCAWLAEAIAAARQKLGFSLWAYVFMPEHVHLLLRPSEANYEIAAILKAIKQPVGTKAIKFLRQSSSPWLTRISVKHGKKLEHFFWQPGGGFDRNVIDPKLILLMIDISMAILSGGNWWRKRKTGNGQAQAGAKGRIY
jgi:putative transposase